MIAGDRSGAGKTTITLALLAFLARQGETVQSFKVGPDYIDPMFHTAITRRPCRNLDPILTSESYVQQCFARHSQSANYALVEGVMGLFDGVNFLPSTSPSCSRPANDYASTAHIARLLNLPVLLAIDCRRLSGSAAAIAQGYRTFDPRVKIVGLVLNQVGSDRHLQLLQEALEPLNLPILGVLRRQDQITIPDRHLGLVPTAEIEQLEAIFDRLADLGKTCFHWDKLLPRLRCPSRPVSSPPEPAKPAIKIAIARDRAFNFYYPDNLDLLVERGAELLPWSPMADKRLPTGSQGLYLGGGFPEVFAPQLAENSLSRRAVRTAIEAGMPIYAECGGLMYLCEQLLDFDGQAWPMVGILPTTVAMGKRLVLGYRRAIAQRDSPALSLGETVWGHEFHRSQLACDPSNPLFQTCSLRSQHSFVAEGWQIGQIHASYIHLHWGGNLAIPERFLQHCLRFHP